MSKVVIAHAGGDNQRVVLNLSDIGNQKPPLRIQIGRFAQ